MKRFKITENQNTVALFNTTQECFEWLKKQDLGLSSYYIECRVDDIEIHSDEFVESFENGECPTDLQYF